MAKRARKTFKKLNNAQHLEGLINMAMNSKENKKDKFARRSSSYVSETSGRFQKLGMASSFDQPDHNIDKKDSGLTDASMKS